MTSMKRWRRTSSGSSNAPANVSVVDVQTDGSTQVIWSFTDDVTSCTDPTGFIVDGQPATAVSAIAANQLLLDYAATHNAAEPAEAIPGLTDIVFLGGGSLAPYTGTTL